MKNLLLLSFISFMLVACHPEKFPGKALHIKNNSNERIYYWYSSEYSVFHYPDTILPFERPVFIASCSAKNSDLASGYNPNWNNIFSQLPDDKFSVYFFE